MTKNEIISKYNSLDGKTITKTELQNLCAQAKGLHHTIFKKLTEAVKKMNGHESVDIKISAPIKSVKPTKKKKTVIASKAKQSKKEDISGLLHGLEYIEDDSEFDGQGLSGNQSVYDFITKLIVDRIKKGGLVWRAGWNADNYNGLPATNYVSKKRYKGINAFLLNFKESENPYFMTMKQVNSRKGAKVKKGSTPWPVIYYKMLYKDLKGQEISEAEAKELPYDEYYSIPIVKYYVVFNGEDIIGIKWPKNNTQTIDFNDISTANTIVENMPQRPPIRHEGSQAYWTPDKVVMPPKKFFKKEAEYYSTLFHELVHSTGYHTRIGRDMSGKFGSKPYAYEELIAELGASFLCGDAGILYHTLDNTAAYIKGWQKRLIGILESDNKFIFKASADAQKAADFILDGKEYEPKKVTNSKDRQPIKSDEKPPTKQPAKQLELSLAGLPGFLRADQEPPQPKEEVGEIFTLPGEVGKWLGEQQRYQLVISMDGETHAGKSELAKKIVDAFAEKGFTIAWLDLEQGGMISKDTKASFERNVSKTNMQRIYVGGGPTTKEDLEKIAQNPEVDVIAIDSASKIKTGAFESNAWMDDFRVKYPNKIFIFIWQQNQEGKTRGGSSANFDAPVHIKVYRPDPTTFEKNYAIFLKNRGNATDKQFRLHDNKILDINASNDE